MMSETMPLAAISRWVNAVPARVLGGLHGTYRAARFVMAGVGAGPDLDGVIVVVAGG
jgi:hypothetical protein